MELLGKAAESATNFGGRETFAVPERSEGKSDTERADSTGALKSN